MENCPVCNAVYTGGEKCHRCKTDLGQLLAVERRAGKCLDLAREAFKINDYQRMQYFAQKSSSLKGSETGRKLASLYKS
ncbi:MAG: hypothetical protein GY846_18760 [Deltaproteobacteria bacterium]|nr:hypothetical protein [Deltaproteobacteria bacterium]